VIVLKWPDGAVTRGSSWTDLLEGVRVDRWNSLWDTNEFRHELARRAWRWNGMAVNTELDDEDFVRALAIAGLFTIEER
jgi:hypothetical protein